MARRSNEWGESLRRTVERSRRLQALLTYSMVEGEQVEIGISGSMSEGFEVGESRIIVARSLGLTTGALEVIQDTSTDNTNWSDSRICLGSIAFTLGGIELQKGGLLRGFLGNKMGVVVDPTAQHFEAGEPEHLLAQYTTLSLEGHVIF